MKIIIIGNSGSGKTWLAQRLAEFTAAPMVNLDDLFWEPGAFVQKRSQAKIDQLIRHKQQEPSWIVEGVFGELAAQFFDSADLLVWLDVEWQLCKARLEKRTSDSGTLLGCEQSDEGLVNLIEWASHYTDRDDLRSFEGHRSLFESFSGDKERLRSERDVSVFLERAGNGTLRIRE